MNTGSCQEVVNNALWWISATPKALIAPKQHKKADTAAAVAAAAAARSATELCRIWWGVGDCEK